MNHPQRLFLAASLLLTATLAQAQSSTLKADDLPYIEVSGTAEKEVVPDEIYLRIAIRERYAGKTKVTLEEQEEKLKNLVKALGISPANLYLADANADYVKVRWQKKDVLTQKDYTLKVTDAATVGRVFQELEKLEITDAAVGRVSHSQLESLRREVKIAAIKAAKDKAEYLLTAIGEHAGKPLIVREENSQGNPTLSNVSVSSYKLQRSGLTEGPEEDDDLQFQKVRIQSTIYVKFAIK
ncbi:SIMPL domain-containing protein [Hymenobacter edaphi]|uniref:SIMPL domain-containing protein n=1 Tax=Hymenobacter edaphi TaxID=2211146 RepID=A0A328BTJ9_9BACT|nr:SIMPL domain-containing protein [Hymenobacter edaphi]RAK70393.1 hypothetical protein DLM85_06020 [Hymenobacter edaphi]